MLKDAKRLRVKIGVVLVLIENHQVLLSRRFNTGTDDGLYICPIGGVELGESASQAIVREALEEVNITIDPEHLKLVHTLHRLHHFPNGSNFVQIDLFFAPDRYQGTIENNEPHKCDDLRFFPLDALPENTVPFIRQALTAIHNGQAYSEIGWDREMVFLHPSEKFTADIYTETSAFYDTHRKADPQLTEKIYQILRTSSSTLDIACGSGNYTIALSQKGLPIEGLDISPEMLALAKAKAPHLNWKEGSMESLPYQENQFDAVLSTFALHYVRQSLVETFTEMKRVLTPGGKVLLYAVALEQCLQYWGGEYFPFARELGYKVLVEKSELEQALTKAGFRNIKMDPFYVSESTQDLFFYACKYRPHLYLDPIVRKCMTPMQYPEYVEEIEKGCALLQKDIESGKIYRVIAQRESTLGEGLLVQAEK